MANPSQLQKSIKKVVDNIPKRLEPPHGLTKSESDIFIRVVNNFAPDYFGAENIDLLVMYARHVAAAEDAAAFLQDWMGYRDLQSDTWLKTYKELQKLYEMNSRAASSFATRLKISKQQTANFRGNQIQSATTKNVWDR